MYTVCIQSITQKVKCRICTHLMWTLIRHTHTCTVIICKYTYVCILYHIMIYYVHMHMQLSAVNIAIILQLHMNAYLHRLDTQHHSHLDVGHSNSCRCQVAVERLVSVSHENSLPANLQTLANVPKTSPVQTHL